MQTPDGEQTLQIFAAPALNDAGELAFLCMLADADGGDSLHASYWYGDGGLVEIFRDGFELGDGRLYGYSPRGHFLLHAGEVEAWSWVYRGLGSPAERLGVSWDGNETSLRFPLAEVGPEPELRLTSTFDWTLNDAGFEIYSGSYSGTEGYEEYGLYQRSPLGEAKRLINTGDLAPGGGVYATLGSHAVINDGGTVAARIKVQEDQTKDVVVRVEEGQLSELAREGNFASDPEIQFGEMTSGPRINAASEVAFSADYSRLGITARGVFLATDDQVSLMAGSETENAGEVLTPGAVIGLSDSGVVAFQASLQAEQATRNSIAVAGASSVEMIAIVGEPAGQGEYLFDDLHLDNRQAFNGAGYLAFEASLLSTVDAALSAEALYVWHDQFGLQEIVRTGDPLDGGVVVSLDFSGSTANIFASNFAPSSSDLLSGLNNQGQVAFAYTLADGREGITLWSPEGVPGDFNNDGLVNLADYTTWRDNLGATAGTLANDSTGEAIGAAQYDLWKSQFDGGDGAPGLSATVPEPSGIGLWLGGVVLALLSIRRAQRARPL